MILPWRLNEEDDSRVGIVNTNDNRQKKNKKTNEKELDCDTQAIEMCKKE